MIGNSKIHHVLAGRASEGVSLGVEVAMKDGVVVVLQIGKYQLPSWAITGGKLGLETAMYPASLRIW